MPLDLGRDATGFGWAEPLVQTGGMVDVQIVYHKDNLVSIRVDHIDQITQDLSAVKISPSWSDPYAPEASQGFYCQKKRTGTVSLILIVLTP
jgi:hypothetical protein